MESLGGGYGYGQSDIDFPPAEGQISSSISSIPGFPPMHLGYSHIQHGTVSSRDSGFAAHVGRVPSASDLYTLPRFPAVVPEGDHAGGITGPNFNHLISRQLSHSPPLSLPHIHGYIPDRSSQSSVPDHQTFGSIMASAASNISTMNIPNPFHIRDGHISVSQSDVNGTDLVPHISVASTHRSTDYIDSFGTVPVSSCSTSTPLNSQPSDSISSHIQFSSTNSAPPVIFTQPAFSESQSVMSQNLVRSDHITNTTACQSRPSRNLSVENLDGDQQVPNAVMSPSSNCSSPSLRNTSTPDNRPAGSLLRQTLSESIVSQSAQNDNMETLRNEQSFANATLIGSELCNSKYIPSLCSTDKSSSSRSLFSADLSRIFKDRETKQSVEETMAPRSRKPHSSQIVGQNHRENNSSNFHANVKTETPKISVIPSSSTSTCSASSSKNESNNSDYPQPKAKKSLNLSRTDDESLPSKSVSSPSSVKSLNEDHTNVIFLKMGKLAKQKSKSSSKIRSVLQKLVENFGSEEVFAKENIPATLEYEEDFVKVEREIAYRLLNFTQDGNSKSDSHNADLDTTITNVDHVINFDESDVSEEEHSSKRRKNSNPVFVQVGNHDMDEEEDGHHADLSDSFPAKADSFPAPYFNFPSEEFGLEGKRNNRQRPFAITSPSFSRSAARAVMTTSVTDHATMVTISIMGKGTASHKTKTKTININHGGIMNADELSKMKSSNKEDKDHGKDINEDECSAEEEDGNCEVGVQKTSIMSKLRRGDTGEENNGCEGEDLVERMEVNIRIDDSQLIQHGDHKRWQCHMCTKSYTTKHNLVTHVLDHNGIKPHLCMVCGKYFKQLSHLNTHMLTHDNIRPHKCTLCGKGFTQISHLKRHQTVHLESKPHICDICGRGFAYPSELKSHKEKHAQGYKDKCDECDAEFDSPRALKLHQLKHENRQDLICKYCDKPFRYPSQLKDHLLSHEGSRPFICTECGMDFMKEHHLKAHQFTHTGQRPYNCPQCGRAFNQRANMMRHMLIHNPTRAFQCDICDKSFSQPQTLKAHKVVHADVKPHKCKICGKQFGRLHNLQGHMHMHNNTKPYICFCGSSFTLKGNLNRHKKVKHGLNESTESMEEQAVSFLSSLSGKLHTEVEEIEDFEFDYEQAASSSDSRSPRKGRKSIPRKILRTMSGKMEDADLTEDEEEEEEEEEEDIQSTGEEGISRYFRALDDIKKESYTLSELSSENYETSDDQSKSRRSVRKHKTPSRIVTENSDNHSNSFGKENEDLSDSEWKPKSTRSSGKGENLNSIIAEKFKKV